MKINTVGTSRSYTRDGVTSHLLASQLDAGMESLATTLVEMQPGGVQKVHSHPQEQCYFVIEGGGTMTVGNESCEVGAGDCIPVPGGTPHGLVNTGAHVLRYFSATAPCWSEEELVQLWPDQSGEE